MPKHRVHIGTSGYHYAHWRGVYYPRELPVHEWLPFYARDFDTVEINNSFYRLPPAAAFDAWKRQAPRGFRFALKYSRFGSHLKHLKDPDTHIPVFLERAELLGARLGPILVQLPPRWHCDVERLDAFLHAAPRRPRWAIEFRHASWLTEEVYRVLERRRAALCIHDMIPNHPRRLTAPFVYLRFHGRRYSGSYSNRRLADLAAWIVELAADREVWAYFNNDQRGYAVQNAKDLRRRLEQG